MCLQCCSRPLESLIELKKRKVGTLCSTLCVNQCFAPLNLWLTAMQNVLILCHTDLFPHSVNKALANDALSPSGIMWGINPTVA